MKAGRTVRAEPSDDGRARRLAPPRLARRRPRLAVLALALAIAGAARGDVRPRMLLLDAALTGGVVVVVGERGTILRSTDRARTWERAAAGVRATLTGVSFAPGADAHSGWAVGHDALILATQDAGRTWTKQYQGDDLQDSFLDVLALDARRAIAVGAYGLLAATSDGGKTWARRKLVDDDPHFNRITRGPGGTLYLAGERGTLLRSRDAGQSWQPIPAPYDGSFYGICPLDGQTLVAYGLEGRVYRSSNDGASWSPIVLPEQALLATAVRLPGNVVALAGNARAQFVSTNAGQSFTVAPASLGTAVAELLELPDGRLLAVGEAGASVLTLRP